MTKSDTNPYGAMADLARSDPEFAWLAPLVERGRELLCDAPHGDLARWKTALAALPPADTGFFLQGGMPSFGASIDDQETLIKPLMALHPWRKGPIQIAGTVIDTEWRSDWKWQRIEPHIDLNGHRVLDIGCGNGYYGWRMLGHGAQFVLGLDPTLVYSMQWLACRHYAGPYANFVLPLGIEDLPEDAGGFDTVFSMGVLYHRRDPLGHLRQLVALCRPGAQVVIETLIVEGQGKTLLEPPARYARMRNVHAIPSLELLQAWALESGLVDCRVLDVSRTSPDEQRSTEWMTFESLDRCLDSRDPLLTVEGHPAPVRAALSARAPD